MEKVVVLLSTYNGGAYLAEQLESLSAQCNVDVEIIVRDDGSTDETVDILNEWQSRGALKWYTGDNMGSAGSFMDLLYNAPDADFYAFCDQDDVWLPDKLQRAVKMIKENGSVNVPSLYFSAQTLVDSDKNVIGYNIPDRLFTFGESLLRNPAAGCTMVFGRKFRRLIVRERPDYVHMHDMWLYMVCLAVGGVPLFDPTPTMLYRQHSKNVVGCNQTFLQKTLRRFRMFLDGKDSIRMKTCEQLLKCYSKDMPERHVDILNCIMAYRTSVKNKFKLLCFKEINTTSCVGRLFFGISVFANRY